MLHAQYFLTVDTSKNLEESFQQFSTLVNSITLNMVFIPGLKLRLIFLCFKLLFSMNVANWRFEIFGFSNFEPCVVPQRILFALHSV